MVEGGWRDRGVALMNGTFSAVHVDRRSDCIGEHDRRRLLCTCIGVRVGTRWVRHKQRILWMAMATAAPPHDRLTTVKVPQERLGLHKGEHCQPASW